MKGFLNHLSNYQVFLASRSPRRKLLLKELGIPFEIWLKEEVEEDFPGGLSNEEVAKHLAKLKADTYQSELKSNHVLITADTIVCKGEQILGKPESGEDALSMLEGLSGIDHEVVTGVCLSGSDNQLVFSATTCVRFSNLTREEILYYVEKFKPFDKAGAYGIQEWIGLIAVESIKGSYFNVMGLPVQRLYHEIKRFTKYNSISNNYE